MELCQLKGADYHVTGVIDVMLGVGGRTQDDVELGTQETDESGSTFGGGVQERQWREAR